MMLVLEHHDFKQTSHNTRSAGPARQLSSGVVVLGSGKTVDAYLSGIVSSLSLSPRNDLSPRSNVVIS